MRDVVRKGQAYLGARGGIRGCEWLIETVLYLFRASPSHALFFSRWLSIFVIIQHFYSSTLLLLGHCHDFATLLV